MSDVSEADWELVNAFHDGELDRESAAQLKARLAREVALAKALDEVALTSRLVSTLRLQSDHVSPPLHGARDGSSQPSRTGAFTRWGAPALAASLAVIVTLAFDRLLPPNTGQDPASISMPRSGEAPPQIVEVSAQDEDFGAPDLEPVGMSPQVSVDFDGGSWVEYSGPNGCRLTYFQANHPPVPAGDAEASLSESWQTSNGRFHLAVAAGMNEARFRAIAGYLAVLSRNSSRSERLMALAKVEAGDQPCLG